MVRINKNILQLAADLLSIIYSIFIHRLGAYIHHVTPARRFHSLVGGRAVGEGEKLFPERVPLGHRLAAHEPLQQRVLLDPGQAGGHGHSHHVHASSAYV